MKSICAFCSTLYRYEKIILRIRERDKETLEIIHFHNLGLEGRGKIALKKLINKATDLKYKEIYLEVYHITDSSGITKINEKLVIYYESVGFQVFKTINNNITMRLLL